MDLRQENVDSCHNPTVYNRLKRYELGCSFCPPNRNENKKNHKKHGVRKPKSKQRDRRKWIPLEEW